MVPPARAPVQPARLRPLNLPRPVEVVPAGREPAPENPLAAGAPRAVRLGRQPAAVAAVDDQWRVEEEWWRHPIRRRYYRVRLADGRPLVLFLELESGQWFLQR